MAFQIHLPCYGHRSSRIGPTHIAFLGTALLAKAANPAGAELPLAHATGRGLTAVRLAHEILELLAQALQVQTFLDDPGPTRTTHWPVPLGE